ncbi:MULTISPECIES: hypothetical protein [Sphingomonadales]|jgi:hypothetical protein|uniref:Uncharacterized protein n=2 Tax=Sphingomonadaceae TaxID=41297 RepID=A0A397PK04_9SPHN|nr:MULTISPECIES: hypothetical protein [Sphingomonadaceae]EKU73316.1 hypothetical protein HMPREF9718_03785 [Sphingobium yanoikuyae ATCC 51230]RIA46051.1 hypothetical protein DFR49_0580 [Hephaestia caeni]WQE08097.1 hypothetical protein U0025_04215 [Sphingobium yanoikuyae]
MIADARLYRLDCSEYFSRLINLCKRIHSSRTGHDRSLSDVIAYRAGRADDTLDHGISVLREHLATIPTTGGHEVAFAISSATLDLLERARIRFSAALDSELMIGDTISLLLFDYVVEDKTEAVMAKLRHRGVF